MRFLRFYIDQDISTGAQICIEAKQAHYIKNVLRLSANDKIQIFNGQGGEFDCAIAHIDKRGVTVTVNAFNPINREPLANIELGLSILKREAMDLAIQKSVEIGVSSIQPLVTERVSVSQKQIQSRLSHWQAVAASSCEQCGLNLIPTVKPAATLTEWCRDALGLRLMGDPDASRYEHDASPQAKSISVLVGPEGGFSEHECDFLMAENFEGVYLGDRILRAETAVASMLTLINHSLLKRNGTNL